MSNYVLKHHGIKGQKWGVRRYQNKDGTLTDAGKLHYNEEYNNYMLKAVRNATDKQDRDFINAYNRVADKANNGGIKKYNEAWKSKHGDNYDDDAYTEGYQKIFNKELKKEFSRETYNTIVNDPNYKKAQELVNKYGKESFDGYKSNQDSLKVIRRMFDPSASVAGAFKKNNTENKKGLDTTKLTAEAIKKTQRQAKKDAEEYARAKMYYGEGAGNRRKLINAKVKQRMKDDPDYKEEFEKHLENQDMEKHAKKAKQERKIRDSSKSLRKNTRKAVKLTNKYSRYVGL